MLSFTRETQVSPEAIRTIFISCIASSATLIPFVNSLIKKIKKIYDE